MNFNSPESLNHLQRLDSGLFYGSNLKFNFDINKIR